MTLSSRSRSLLLDGWYYGMVCDTMTSYIMKFDITGVTSQSRGYNRKSRAGQRENCCRYFGGDVDAEGEYRNVVRGYRSNTEE
ncbi:hypothetical protein LSH36_115g09022 [Paralvinella palmiformis]|uniref:Uncharacterized protein n=1 Tax=Paralvinella palmiformis TaxID=53620 RepID=A0AAD9JZ10_9ANNE|nr:hypothetical protein LSH36_115g09022 [Paralvinella palmiformis]